MPLEKIQTGSVRRKIIFVFLTFAVAFAISFVISRTAFREMMERVEKITIPDLKLRLVHQVNRQMVQLATAKTINEQYRDASQGMAASLDSLALLYETDDNQSRRINSLKQLIAQRDSIFSLYVDVRRRIILNPTIDLRLQSLERIIGQSTPDSLIRSTERQKIATRVEGPENAEPEERGFFSRIFGSRRSSNSSEPSEKRIVREEVKIQVDTITSGQMQEASAEIGRVVQEIQTDHSQSRSQYLSREVELANADGILVNNIFQILQSVEKEALLQSEVENLQARAVVNRSINRITIVFIVVVLVIAIMVYFILADVRKNNAYRGALEAAKEEAEYHAAAKQRFLANMSHELRTPLQSIVGYAEQLKMKHWEEEGMVDAIHQSTEHLLQIVNEILDYSRINSGKIILEEQPVDMHEITEKIIEIMQPLALKKSLVLVHNVEADPEICLAGDPYRIRQILFNLLSNAIKFTEKGSVTVDIKVRTRDARTVIRDLQAIKGPVSSVLLDLRVADTGIGIASENIERIFEDFEQAEQQEPDGIYKGSGLGLSIVKAICESMGGSIRVESKVGDGTEFRVSIPLRVAPDICKQERTLVAGQPTRALEGPVWIIDDDKLILQLCEMILGKYGIPYRSFSSPRAVLLAALDNHPDMVLMDIRMPGMDGFVLNQELRKRLNRPEVPIYAFTAQALPEEQSNILSRGFDGILLKPFREKDLLNLLGVWQEPSPAKRAPEASIGAGAAGATGAVAGQAQSSQTTESATTPNQTQAESERSRGDEDRHGDDGNREDEAAKFRALEHRAATLFDIDDADGRIRALFVSDTLDDLRRLRQYHDEQALGPLSFISHRLAGRIAQFGEERLAFQLRKIEIDTRNGELPEHGLFKDILSRIEQYVRLVNEPDLVPEPPVIADAATHSFLQERSSHS